MAHGLFPDIPHSVFLDSTTLPLSHSPIPQAVKQAQESVKRVLAALDAALATRTFLVGERVTLADISLVCNLLLLYKQVRREGRREGEEGERKLCISVNHVIRT